MTRHCYKCGAGISGCNGFCHAGDMEMAFAGVIAWVSVKELCGRCVLIVGGVLDEFRRETEDAS